MLARRLFGGLADESSFDLVLVTILTPVEYCFCGPSEEEAKSQFGEENIDVLGSLFCPFEWSTAQRQKEECYVKLIVKRENKKVIGFQYIGPNARMSCQGFAGMISLGATVEDFDEFIKIQGHEIF